MTTWQEEPPMSRRALRESERAQAQATLSRADEVNVEEEPVDQQIWVQPPGPESLQYTTQVRPQMPHYDGQSFRARQSADVPPAADAPSYRLRDFSPDARGTSFTPTRPVPSAPWEPAAAASGDLDYHTSVEAPRAAPTATSAPVVAPPKLGTPAPVETAEEPSRVDPEDVPHDHTLSRRELRALRNAAAAPVIHDAPIRHAPIHDDPIIENAAIEDAVPVAPEPVAPPVETLLPPVAPEPKSSAEVDAAMAEFDALYSPTPAPSHSEPIAPTAVNPSPPVVQPPVVQAPAVQAPAAQPPAAQLIEAGPIREVVTAPEVYTRPIGHWSSQAGIDDQYQVTEHTLSRNLAASDSITTSALVLPSFPQSGSFTAPVSGTGEILITGSIDLPRSLGMSGRNPSRYDSPDVDSIIDAADREDAAPDSAPVRAIRAVSTHTSSQGIIATKRPKGNNLPVILSITAGVMMVSVVVLFVAGMIFKIF